MYLFGIILSVIGLILYHKDIYMLNSSSNILNMYKLCLALFSVLLFIGCTSSKVGVNPDLSSNQNPVSQRWSEDKIWKWYNSYPWLAGTNFNPSTAINQLEFWQADTYDRATIDRELKWSADLGFNMHRVYLHNLLWDQDKDGFLKRLDDFLTIADGYEIKIMFVLLDDVWHPAPKLGKQPEPIPHVHNSGWVQAPGYEILGNLERHDELEPYIKGVISHFADDERVIAWDLYNEPDNVAQSAGRAELEPKPKATYSFALLKKVFQWAREVNPSQPISSGIWKNNPDHWGTPDSMTVIDRFMITQSDFINFHAYDGMDGVIKKVTELKKLGRPMICTEYLARGNGNKFENVMQFFHDEKIGAINWGFVAGKTQTNYPWSSWQPDAPKEEPEVWHHEILRKNGTPYDQAEVDLIKSLTQQSK